METNIWYYSLFFFFSFQFAVDVANIHPGPMLNVESVQSVAITHSKHQSTEIVTERQVINATSRAVFFQSISILIQSTWVYSKKKNDFTKTQRSICKGTECQI